MSDTSRIEVIEAEDTEAAKERCIPHLDRVLVRIIPDHKGKIITPQSAHLSDPRGEVVAVGRGEPLRDGTYRPLLVKPGDIVLLEGRSRIVRLNGEKLHMFSECSIAAVIQRKDHRNGNGLLSD